MSSAKFGFYNLHAQSEREAAPSDRLFSKNVTNAMKCSIHDKYCQGQTYINKLILSFMGNMRNQLHKRLLGTSLPMFPCKIIASDEFSGFGSAPAPRTFDQKNQYIVNLDLCMLEGSGALEFKD